MKKFRYYGRKDVNKLDWLLAISCVTIALGAIWFSIGLSITNTGAATIPAFKDLLNGLSFNFKAGALAIVLCILIYCTVLYAIVGTICLCLAHKKNHVPGVFATLIALLGAIVFVSLIYEFAFGVSKEVLNPVFPYIEMVFVAYLVALAAFAVYATYSKYNIEFGTAESPKKEAKPKEEPKEEAKPEPVKEEAKPEPVKEEKAKAAKKEKKQKPEPVKEEVKPEPVEEEPEEVEEDESEEDEEKEGYMGLGPRRRKIPFESKLKKVDHDTFERYSQIVEELRKYDLNDRISIPGETFSHKKHKIVFLTFAGNTLKAFIALDPKTFEGSTIPVKDMSDVKKFEQTPCMLVVKSNLAARRVIDLAKQAFLKHRVMRKQSK